MAARSAHYLRRAGGCARPPAIIGVSAGRRGDGVIVWAICTDVARRDGSREVQNMHGVLAGGFWMTLRCAIKRSPGVWVVFCGAVAQLSLLGFWELLEGEEWRLTDTDPFAPGIPMERGRKPWEGYAVLQDPPTIVVARPRGNYGTCKMIDVRNYGVSGWSALGEVDGEVLDGPAQHTLRSALVYNFMNEWESMIADNSLGGVQATAASQAMHTFRHRYLRSPVLVHANYKALELERAALYAGRCECWTVGRVRGPIYHLDMNSCYPAVARAQAMPSRLAGIVEGCSPAPRDLMDRGYLVISEVSLETTEARYPLRVLRSKHGASCRNGAGGSDSAMPLDGDTIYPVGNFSTALCGPELQVAYAAREVRKVHRTAYYEGSELFTEWADSLSHLQSEAVAEGRRAQAEGLKRLRNSLFGKFAQWRWQWRACPTQHARAPYCLWYGLPMEVVNLDADEVDLRREPVSPSRTGVSGLVRYRAIGWTVQVEEGMGEHPESCPAISAWVYSLARVALLYAIETCGREYVHYMDADSLWVNHTGMRRMQDAGLLHPTRLGAWKVKGSHEWAHFHGLKAYTTPVAEVHAGAPPDAAGSHAAGWEYLRPERLMPALAVGRAPGAVDVPHKLLSSNRYRFGRVSVGGRVIPLELFEVQ